MSPSVNFSMSIWNITLARCHDSIRTPAQKQHSTWDSFYMICLMLVKKQWNKKNWCHSAASSLSAHDWEKNTIRRIQTDVLSEREWGHLLLCRTNVQLMAPFITDFHLSCSHKRPLMVHSIQGGRFPWSGKHERKIKNNSKQPRHIKEGANH